MNELYDNDAVTIMKIADQVSDMSSNRIQEIRRFAIKGGYQRIGIAHCFMFDREVAIIKAYLQKNFEVITVDCKYGRLQHKALFGGGSPRVICNPAGQADYLNNLQTDLNLSVGLCVGHDMVFNKHSAAPVTSLFDKDFTNGNNMDAALADIECEL